MWSWQYMDSLVCAPLRRDIVFIMVCIPHGCMAACMHCRRIVWSFTDLQLIQFDEILREMTRRLFKEYFFKNWVAKTFHFKISLAPLLSLQGRIQEGHQFTRVRQSNIYLEVFLVAPPLLDGLNLVVLQLQSHPFPTVLIPIAWKTETLKILMQSCSIDFS